MPDAPIVSVRGLVKRYGDATVLDVPALDLAAGTCVGLVGNNGAGKTTLIRAMLDLLRPTAGEARIAGHPVAEGAAWKRHVGAFLDASFLVDFLRPREHFRLVGGAYGMAPAAVDARVDALAPFLGRALGGGLIRDLSMGNAAKVGVVAAVLPAPALVVLDEPFANLDPGARIALERLVAAERDRGACVLVSSHDLDPVASVCDRVLVLAGGRVVRDTPSTPSTLGELRAYFAEAVA